MEMKNKFCKIFGHKFELSPVLLSFQFVPSLDGENWEKITFSADTTYCARCGYVPCIPDVVIGTEDSHMGFTGYWQVGDLTLYGPTDNLVSKWGGLGERPAQFFPGK